MFDFWRSVAVGHKAINDLMAEQPVSTPEKEETLEEQLRSLLTDVETLERRGVTQADHDGRFAYYGRLQAILKIVIKMPRAQLRPSDKDLLDQVLTHMRIFEDYYHATKKHHG